MENSVIKTKKLIPIMCSENGGLLVDARLLHEKLCVSTRFSDWIKRRINEYNFEEGLDFTIITQKRVTGGVPLKEYQLTIDTAKEFAMVERSEIGRTFRKYFIEVEKQLREKKGYIVASGNFGTNIILEKLKALSVNGTNMYKLDEVRTAMKVNDELRLRYPDKVIEIGGVMYVNKDYIEMQQSYRYLKKV